MTNPIDQINPEGKPIIYVLAFYRGYEGDDAEQGTTNSNSHRAIAFGEWLQRKFPNYLVYVPHKEVMCNEAWRQGLVDSDNVMDICKTIVKYSILGVALEPISQGMAEEIAVANENDIPIVTSEGTGEKTFDDVALALAGIRYETE